MATTPNLGLVLTPDGNTNWGNDQRTNLSKIDTFAGAAEKTANKGVANGYASLDATGNVPASELHNASIPAPVGSKQYYVDGSRTDSYTATGDVNHPFKTIMAAVNRVIANGDSLGNNPAYLILIAPGVYSETINIGSSAIGNICFSSLMPDDSQINTVTVNGPGGNGVCLTGTTGSSLSAAFYGINFFNGSTPNGNVLTDSSGSGSFECVFLHCFFDGGASNAFVFNNVPVVGENTNFNTSLVFNGANQWFNMKSGKFFGGSVTFSGAGCYTIIERGTDFGPSSFTIPSGVEFYLYSGSRLGQSTNVTVQSGGLFVGRDSAVRGTLTVQAGGTATLDDCWVANYSGPITSNGTLFTSVLNATTGFQITGDTGLSRTAAGVLALGNGTAGDTSGTLQCTHVTVPAGAPSITIGASGNGIGSSGANIVSIYASSGEQVEIGLGSILVSASSMFRWSVAGTGTTVDAAISHVGSKTVAIGDGANYTNTNGNLQLNQITKYNNETVAAAGVPYVRAAVLEKAETGTDNNVLSLTPAPVVGLYRVTIWILVTSQSGANLNWGVSWTASDGIPKNGMGSGILLIGSSSVLTNFGNLGGYFATEIIDVDNSATPIVVQINLTAGTITYKASAVIERLI